MLTFSNCVGEYYFPNKENNTYFSNEIIEREHPKTTVVIYTHTFFKKFLNHWETILRVKNSVTISNIHYVIYILSGRFYIIMGLLIMNSYLFLIESFDNILKAKTKKNKILVEK